MLPPTLAIAEMVCGPPQPAVIAAGSSAFVPVPPGSQTVTVYAPAAGPGVNLAWLQSRNPTNLTADYALALLGQTVQSNIPAGANYLRITSPALAEVWCAWEA